MANGSEGGPRKHRSIAIRQSFELTSEVLREAAALNEQAQGNPAANMLWTMAPHDIVALAIQIGFEAIRKQIAYGEKAPSRVQGDG